MSGSGLAAVGAGTRAEQVQGGHRQPSCSMYYVSSRNLQNNHAPRSKRRDLRALMEESRQFVLRSVVIY